MADAKFVVAVEGRDNLSQELKRIESGVIRFVGAIASAATAIAAIGFPIAEAAKFQRELLNTAKTTDFAREDLIPLKQGLVDLSTQINVTAVDLAKIATMGGQIGIGKAGPAALLEFTKTVATAVSALDLSAEEVVASFGKLVNIFNIPPSQFRNAMAALNEVSNVSNATADQLFDVVRRIGNLGGAFTLPGAAAVSAAMIDLGFSAETAGTSLTKLFADFASNSAEFAALVKNDAIKTTEDWVKVVGTDGVKAIRAYVDALNALPADQAAAQMVSLTGSGRMFSMVQKLREQRARELDILKQAQVVEKNIEDIVKGRVAGSDLEVRALRDRASALRNAAREASVLSRLTQSATDAFAIGDSAEKEQRTVLGSLTAQWTVFLNNITALAMSVGDVFLPPLTEALQEMSKALQDPVNADSFRRGAEGILEAVSLVTGAIKSLTEAFRSLEGTGVDWGSWLKVGALIGAFTAFKGLMSILSALGRQFVVAIPGVNALGVALFGSVEQADKAAAGLNAAGASAVRTGGQFAKIANAVRSATTAVATETARLVAASTAADAALAKTQKSVAANQTQIASLFSGKFTAPFASIISAQGRIWAMQTRINAVQQRYYELNKLAATGVLTNAAIAERWRLRSELRVLRTSLATYQELEARAVRYQAVLARSTTRADAARIRVLLDAQSIPAQLARLRNTIVTAGATAGASYASSFMAGTQAGFTGVVGRVAAQLAKIVAAAANAGKQAAVAIGAGFATATTTVGTTIRSIVAGLMAVSAAAVRAGRSIQTMGVSAASGGFLVALNAFAGGITNVLGKAMASLALVIGGGFRTALSAAGASLTALVSRKVAAAAAATGLADAWALASTSGSRLAKTVTLLSIAFVGLGKAVGVVFRTLMSFVNVAFMAWLLVDVLKAIGLWDKLALSVQRVFDFLGMEVPSFLRTEEQERDAARVTDAIRQMYEGAATEAAKFNNEAKATLTLTKDWQNVAKAITFDPQQPTFATDDAMNRFRTAIAAYAKIGTLVSQIEQDNVRIALSEERIAQAQRQAAGQGGAVARFVASSKQLKEETAIRDNLVRQNALRAEELKFITDTADVQQGIVNLMTAALTQGEAQALFSRQWVDGANDGLSVLEQLVKLEDERLALKVGELAVQEKLDPTKTKNLETAAMLELRDGAAKYGDLIRENTNKQNALRDSLKKASEGGELLVKMVDDLNASADRGGANRLTATLQRLYETNTRFQGLRVASIKANDLISAAAVAQVSTRFAQMYSSWADAASTAAQRAKNYAVQVAGDIARLFDSTTKAIEGTERALQASELAAKRTRVDRERQRETDERVRQVNVVYDLEATRIRELFAEREEFMNDELAANERARQRALEPITDAAAFATAKGAVADQLTLYRQLIVDARRYKEQVAAANEILKDPNQSLANRSRAERDILEGVENLKNTYAEAAKIRAQLISAPPAGGRALFGRGAQEIQEVTAGLEEIQQAIKVVGMAGANTIKELYETQATTFRNQAQLYVSQAEAALGRFNQQIAAQGGGDPDKALRGIALSLVQAGTLKRVFGEIDQMLADGLIDPSKINIEALTKMGEKAIQDVGKTQPITIPVNVTMEEEAMVERFVRFFRSGMQKGINEVKTKLDGESTKASVDGSISPASLKKMNEDIQAGVRPEIQGTLKIVNTPEVTVKGNLEMKNARGGLVGEAISLSSSLVRFARGGYNQVAPERLVAPLERTAAQLSPIILKSISNFAGGGSTIPSAASRVKGPGTGTSDSILSWLSNGEYVIDAMTTARFGPDFFRRLQLAARGGVSTKVLREINLPKFAEGGAVMEPIFNLPDASAGEEKSTVVAEHAVSLTINGKSVGRLRGSREAVKGLVSALKELERGV